MSHKIIRVDDTRDFINGEKAGYERGYREGLEEGFKRGRDQIEVMRFEAAKAAMQGLLTNVQLNRSDHEEIAHWAVAQADALLAELDKGEK